MGHAAVRGAGPQTDGLGVDADTALLDRGRDSARAGGLSGRVTFVESDATTWAGSADRVLCLGASHAWSGFESTWRAGRHQWVATHPADPAAGEVRETLRRQMDEYSAVYRGRLGFVYVVLTRA